MSRRAQLRGDPNVEEVARKPASRTKYDTDFFKRTKAPLLGSRQKARKAVPMPATRPRYPRPEALNVLEELPLVKAYSAEDAHVLTFDDGIGFSANNIVPPLEAWRIDQQHERVETAFAETGAGSHFGRKERMEASRRRNKAWLARNPDQKPLPVLTLREGGNQRYTGEERPNVSKGAFRYFTLQRHEGVYKVSAVDKWYAMTKQRKLVTLSAEDASNFFDKPAPLSVLERRVQAKIKEEAEYNSMMKEGLAITTDDALPENIGLIDEAEAKPKRGKAKVLTVDEVLEKQEVNPDNDPDNEDIDNVSDGFEAPSDDEGLEGAGDINQRTGNFDLTRESRRGLLEDETEEETDEDSDDEGGRVWR